MLAKVTYLVLLRLPFQLFTLSSLHSSHTPLLLTPSALQSGQNIALPLRETSSILRVTDQQQSKQKFIFSSLCCVLVLWASMYLGLPFPNYLLGCFCIPLSPVIHFLFDISCMSLLLLHTQAIHVDTELREREPGCEMAA